MTVLSITRKTANTLITAAGFNTNYDEIEAVVNAIGADNLAADCVTKTQLHANVVRSDYGLIQHTDGALYVDVSDTNPGLELTDGGLRAKVDDSSIERAAGGLQVKANGITAAMLADDLVFATFPLTPSAEPDADYEVANKKYVDDHVPTFGQAVGTTDINTNSAAYTDMTGMSVAISGAGEFLIMFSGPLYASTSTNGNIIIDIDGANEATAKGHIIAYSASAQTGLQFKKTLAAGDHTIKVQWKANLGGTVYQNGSTDAPRILTVMKVP